MPQQQGAVTAQQLDADAALVRTFRLRETSSVQQNQAVQRLHQWSAARGIPCGFLFKYVNPTQNGRMAFSIDAEQLFIRYVTDIVRNGSGKCGPESAMQYVTKIRGAVNQLQGFTMQQYSKHQTLDSTVQGLGITDPQKRLTRGPMLQQHQLKIESLMDMTEHANRAIMALLSTCAVLNCRVKDLTSDTKESWNKSTCVSVGDVSISSKMLTITIRDHKTKDRTKSTELDYKFCPAPKVAFPVSSMSTMSELTRCCRTDAIPTCVRLSPYFQVNRLVVLGNATTRKRDAPLFSYDDGTPISYRCVYFFLRRASALDADLKAANLLPHSGRHGAATTSKMNGTAMHVRQAHGLWSSGSSMPERYASDTIQQLSDSIHKTCASTHTVTSEMEVQQILQAGAALPPAAPPIVLNKPCVETVSRSNNAISIASTKTLHTSRNTSPDDWPSLVNKRIEIRMLGPGKTDTLYWYDGLVQSINTDGTVCWLCDDKELHTNLDLSVVEWKELPVM